MILHTNRILAGLMVLQCVACVILAVTVTPLTWVGEHSSWHVHLIATWILAPLLTVVPLLLWRMNPTAPLIRHVFAAAQVMFSALLIHLTGGRIETHFHVFGSLAILAFYRDMRVLLTATALVALDHAVRGIYAPQSVFGVIAPSSWRWVEHAAWVMFEVFFLTLSIRREQGAAVERACLVEELEARGANAEWCVEQQRHALNTACIVAVTDTSGEITHVNEAFCEMQGESEDELVATRHVLLCADEVEGGLGSGARRLITSGKTWRGEARRYGRDGRPYWTDTTIVPYVGLDGEIEQFVEVSTDITERKLAETAKAESDERYALAVMGSRDALWDWNLLTDRIYFAPRWSEMLGIELPISDSPKEWFGRIVSAQLSRFHAELTRHLKGQSNQFDMEVEMTHADGSSRWMLCRAAAVRDEDGRAVRLAGSLADISDLKHAQAKLHRMAHHDHLTGLPNRELFAEHLKRAVSQHKRHPEFHFAVLFFDFDRFKVINDGLGHAVGDALLAGIAERFRKALRAEDIAARFGGDEFVVLLGDLESPDDADAACRRLLGIMSAPHHLDGQEVISTASIGVVTSAHECDDPAEIIRDADAAMYEAKSNGRAQYRVFDKEMHDNAVQQLSLEQDLRKPNITEQMQLLFQPIITLDTGQIVGFEGLIRWMHPVHGIVSPDRFISIAEETGVIVRLGEWAIDAACKQVIAWRELVGNERPLAMNINLSKRQMIQPDFVDRLEETLRRNSMNPADLKLEVTETAIMDNRHDTVPVLQRIRSLGIQLAMDDFGTGHSSLSCLQEFPLNVLKIDRSFVKNMEERREFAAVMHAIITLAHHLNLDVVAEGVEKKGQLVQLQSMECRFAQGYLFSRPVDAEEATAMLLNWSSAELRNGFAAQGIAEHL